MGFTDDDVKSLLKVSKYFEGGEDNGYRKMIVALVKRLKCAEKVVKAYEQDAYMDKFERLRKAWIKSKGE